MRVSGAHSHRAFHLERKGLCENSLRNAILPQGAVVSTGSPGFARPDSPHIGSNRFIFHDHVPAVGTSPGRCGSLPLNNRLSSSWKWAYERRQDRRGLCCSPFSRFNRAGSDFAYCFRWGSFRRHRLRRRLRTREAIRAYSLRKGRDRCRGRRVCPRRKAPEPDSRGDFGRARPRADPAGRSFYW